MIIYSCDICCFKTTLKCNYSRHLKTRKHIKNETKQPTINETVQKSSYKMPKIPSNLEGVTLQNPPVAQKKKSKTATSPKEIFSCDHCDKKFSRQDNLKRHIVKRCNQNTNTSEIKEMFQIMKSEHAKEKEELKQQIELLLNKVCNISVENKTYNTTINNTIVLNNFGQEDMSHISSMIKTKLLKIPYGMIPKMIEYIHFNDEKPENKNIILPNSRDNKLKIFKNNKWIYKDKTDTLNDIIDRNYYILDAHFDTSQDTDNFISLNETEKDNYTKFKQHIEEGEKTTIENLKRDCELILLNNR
jgi:hypothetical protein